MSSLRTPQVRNRPGLYRAGIALVLIFLSLLPIASSAQEQEPPENHRGLILNLAWSPDGTTLLVSTERGLWLIRPDELDNLRFYRPTSIFDDAPYWASVAAAEYSPDGLVIAVNAPAGLELIDAETLTLLASVPSLGGLNFNGDIRFTADGQTLVWAGRFDLMIANLAAVLEGVSSGDCMVRASGGTNIRSGPGSYFGREGSLAAGESATAVVQTVGQDGYTWYALNLADPWPYGFVRADLVTQTEGCDRLPRLIFSEDTNSAYALTRSIAIHPTRPLFASTNFGNLHGRVTLWNLETGQQEYDLASGVVYESMTSNSAGEVIFTQDGTRLLQLWEDGGYGIYVRAWTGSGFVTGDIFVEPDYGESDHGSLWDADLSGDGTMLAIVGTQYIHQPSSNTRRPRIWIIDTRDASLIRTLEDIRGDNYHVDWSPDQRLLAYASDSRVSIYDLQESKLIAEIERFTR